MTDRIEDERVAFYLRHQDLIDTWAAVRSDALSEARRFYLGLGDDLEELASELGDDVLVWRRDGRHCNVGLYRREWSGEDEPLLAAALETKDATFADGWRIVGWRVDYRAEKGKALRDAVGSLVKDVRASRGFPERNNWWPARRIAHTPTGEYWLDLSSHREALVGEIREAWEAFADDIQFAFIEWSKRTV